VKKTSTKTTKTANAKKKKTNDGRVRKEAQRRKAHARERGSTVLEE